MPTETLDYRPASQTGPHFVPRQVDLGGRSADDVKIELSGEIKAKKLFAVVEIPETVQGTILARVDRLAPRERELLHQAAVIGRSFSTGLIEAVVGEGDLGAASG